MKRKPTQALAISFFTFFGMASSEQSSAATIIDNDTGGMYNVGIGDMADYYGPEVFLGPDVSEGDPDNANLPEPTVFGSAFGSNWLEGNYSGGSWTSTSNVPNEWVVNQEMAVVYDFSLANRSKLRIELGADNGLFVWLDGVYLLGATARGPQIAAEYVLDLASVSAGDHSLQFIFADHGERTGYLINVTAESISEVPLPGTLSLLAIGLAGLGFMRRDARR